MARSTLRRLGTVLMVLAAFVATTFAAGCTVTSSSSAVIVPPSTIRCAVLYTSSWGYLGMVTSDGSGKSVSMSGLKGRPAFVEYYRGSDCEPSAYVDAGDCVEGAAPPVTTTPPTTPPTTRPTSTMRPTTRPTSTMRPTNPPTTPPTTRPTSTMRPTTPPTAKPTTTSAPPTTKPTTPSSGGAIPGYTGGPPASMLRAMYVWELSACLFNGVSASAYPRTCQGATSAANFQDLLLANATRPFNTYAPYNRLFVEISMDVVRNQPDLLRSFIGKATAAGVAIEHLSGDANWVTSTAATNTPIQMCKDLAAFNKATTNAAQRLTGIHLDIEPHVLDGWRTNTGAGKDNYNDVYQNNLIAIFRACKTAANAAGLTVAWDTGSDYYQYVTDLWSALLANPFVDYVNIMNYYDDKAEFLNGRDGVGGVNKILANLNGKIPVVFAAETIMPPYCPPEDSFWQEGTLPLENMIGDVGRQFSGSRGFLGLATHHYGSYILLPANGGK